MRAQCKCEKIKRDDGTTVTQCPPLQITSDNKSEIGLSVASTGTKKYIAITIRFSKNALNAEGNLTLRLLDNSMIVLEFVNSNLGYIGNSEITNSIYKLSENNLAKLKNSDLKTISFKLSNNLMYTYEIKMNADVAKKEIKCL